MTTMNKLVGMGPLLGVLATAAFPSIARAACSTADPAGSSANGLVMVLLDRSGSMAADAECDGVRRKWECGVKAAKEYVAGTDDSNERAYFVWQFATKPDVADYIIPDEGVVIGGRGRGYCQAEMVTKLEPTDALVGPLVDDAATPLAGAYCRAVTFLRNYRDTVLMKPTLPLFIKLVSDGLENDTPVGAECQSDLDGISANYVAPVADPVIVATPAPGTVDGLLIGSWQANMYDYAITGTSHSYSPLSPDAFKLTPGFPATSIIENITFIEDFVEGTAAARTLRAANGFGGVDGVMAEGMRAMSTSAVAAAATTTPIQGFINMLGSVAAKSGGRMSVFGSGTPQPAGSPYAVHAKLGDANDNGCVNTADFNLVKANYGLATTPSKPDTFRADLNLDGIVNASDYRVLSKNWGNGCSPGPGPLPLLGPALFGFEVLSNWTATAPISITAAKKSEGLFSLNVAGSGWREIRTGSFNTNLFTGVTSKIAFDVLIPQQQSNPAWLGQVLLFVNAPSAGLNNVSLGTVELSGRQRNVFAKAQFNIPANVKTAMQTARSDFSFKIVVNANNAGYQLDNLRFVP